MMMAPLGNNAWPNPSLVNVTAGHYVPSSEHLWLGMGEKPPLDAVARGWQAEVYWACIDVQFATQPPGIAAEGVAMQVLAQVRGSCSSAFLQVGAGHAMEWKQGERRKCTFCSVSPRCRPTPAKKPSASHRQVLQPNLIIYTCDLYLSRQCGLLVC